MSNDQGPPPSAPKEEMPAPSAPALQANNGFNFMSSSSNLPRLDGKNFQSWLEMISIALKLRGLKRAIESEDADEISDLSAKLILLETMDES